MVLCDVVRLQDSLLQVAQREFESDVRVALARFLRRLQYVETDIDGVFVGTDFWEAAEAVIHRDAQHLGRFRAAQHLLVSALRGQELGGNAAAAQDMQNNAQAVVQGHQRRQPAFEILLTLGGCQGQPVVVGRNVELAHAPRDAGTLLDAHQPFIVAQRLADLAGVLAQQARGLFDFLNDFVEDVFSNRGVAAQAFHDDLLAIEFLQQVGLQLGAVDDVEDLENTDQRRVVVELVVATQVMLRFDEQVFQTQQCAYAFVEWIVVTGH